jgi:hypothetical protein
MRILYILKHNPWGVGGGSSASLMYLTAFKSIFKDCVIELCIAAECADTIPLEWYEKCNIHLVPKRSLWKRILSCITGIMHRYQDYGRKLLRKNEYMYCIFDHNSIAGSLISNVCKKTKSVVIHHNFEMKYFRDNTSSWLIKILLLHQIKKNEKRAYRLCDYNIFLTDEDGIMFKNVYGYCKGICKTVGVFEVNHVHTTKIRSLETNPITIVITGSLDNLQNNDGIAYFMTDIYPYIDKSIRIIIAGKNPTKEIYAYIAGKKNVSLIANPQNMQQIICNGTIFVCPTRLGGGIKVRITDALKYGLPVITHSISSRGYLDYINAGYMYSYTTLEEFIYSLNRAINSITNNYTYSQAIYDFYWSHNSLASDIKRIKSLIEY